MEYARIQVYGDVEWKDRASVARPARIRRKFSSRQVKSFALPLNTVPLSTVVIAAYRTPEQAKPVQAGSSETEDEQPVRRMTRASARLEARSREQTATPIRQSIRKRKRFVVESESDGSSSGN